MVGEIAIGGREPVGAVLARHAAELPQRLLQALGQSREAFPALNGAHMLPAREGEPEVIEHMLERLAGDRHREGVGMGEVRQGLTTGRMLLPEDELTFRSFRRPPVRDTALQGAQHPVRKATGMKALQLFQHSGRTDCGDLLQERDDVLAPDLVERVGAGAILAWRTLARQNRRLLHTPPRALAEPRPGRRGRLRMTCLA